jgi:two-component system phosphate regulon response regulator PhoB
MSSHRVLIVYSDDATFLPLIRTLRERNIEIGVARDSESGLRRARRETWDLVIVEYHLPSIDGLDVCRRLKRHPRTGNLPVIIVSSREDEADIVASLELGADDYVTKPFNLRIIVTKILAILRSRPHSRESAMEVIEVQGIAIHPGRHEVRTGDRRVTLSVTEFELLRLLARHPGRAFHRREILKALRGQEHFASERAVDVQVAGLRRRLGPWGNRIETVRGVGYRLRAH